MRAIVYDTGALLAAERRNPDFLALHDERTCPIIRVVVLAQAWRGGTPAPDLPRAQRLRRTPGRRPTGRAAGLACAASRTADVVGTIVITTAVRHQAPAVTSDPRDRTRIADCIGVKIRIFAT